MRTIILVLTLALGTLTACNLYFEPDPPYIQVDAGPFPFPDSASPLDAGTPPDSTTCSTDAGIDGGTSPDAGPCCPPPVDAGY